MAVTRVPLPLSLSGRQRDVTDTKGQTKHTSLDLIDSLTILGTNFICIIRINRSLWHAMIARRQVENNKNNSIMSMMPDKMII